MSLAASPGAGPKLAYGIEYEGIAGEIVAGGHNYNAVQAAFAQQFAQILDCGRRRRERAVRRIRNPRRIEDMHMTIAAAARNIEIDGRPEG
jgi:hypothetical protein